MVGGSGACWRHRPSRPRENPSWRILGSNAPGSTARPRRRWSESASCCILRTGSKDHRRGHRGTARAGARGRTPTPPTLIRAARERPGRRRRDFAAQVAGCSGQYARRPHVLLYRQGLGHTVYRGRPARPGNRSGEPGRDRHRATPALPGTFVKPTAARTSSWRPWPTNCTTSLAPIHSCPANPEDGPRLDTETVRSGPEDMMEHQVHHLVRLVDC